MYHQEISPVHCSNQTVALNQSGPKYFCSDIHVALNSAHNITKSKALFFFFNAVESLGFYDMIDSNKGILEGRSE